MRSKGLTQEVALKRSRSPTYFHRIQPLQPKPKSARPELLDQEVNRCISSMLEHASASNNPKDIRREKNHLYLKLVDASTTSIDEVSSISKEERLRWGRLACSHSWMATIIVCRKLLLEAVSSAQSPAEIVSIIRDTIQPLLQTPVQFTPRFRWMQQPRVVTSLLRIVEVQQRCHRRLWHRVKQVLLRAFPSLAYQLKHVSPKSIETFYFTQVPRPN